MGDGVIIYTDGGCSGNPGPGGWAFVIRFANDDANPAGRDSLSTNQAHNGGPIEITGSGGEANTTNNRMELRAVISSLEEAERRIAVAIPVPPVVVYTDSQYVKNGIGSWMANWKRNGWRTADKKPVKNKELWEELDLVNARVKPKYLWVKGHAGVDGNERCDEMVQDEIRKFR